MSPDVAPGNGAEPGPASPTSPAATATDRDPEPTPGGVDRAAAIGDDVAAAAGVGDVADAAVVGAGAGGVGGTARAAAGMGAITAVSRALGMVRVLVVAAVLGSSFLGNAFQSANSVSNVLFELLAAGALSAVLVPAFVSRLDRRDQTGAEEVAGGVLGVALAGLGVVTVLGVVFAPLLARALTVGVPESVAADQRALVTFLLRFFVPQILLYAAGTVAAAVLYAERRFPVTAAAPIGNTVVMVACLVAFRAVAGPDPGLDLTLGEKLLLVAAGTGGVIAFVGILLGACERSGFRLRPRLSRGDARVREVLAHSGWGVVLHTGAGLLLGAAIVAGAAVEGGVVAYQVGWVIFLAPYAVLAQPIHTAILPELVTEAREHGLDRVARSLRWALERMAVLLVPLSAGMIALAGPAMRLVPFGRAGGDGPELLAAAVAGLALGLLPYSAFLLLARGYYALGESRLPGLVSVGAATLGVIVMTAGALTTHGAARIAILGLGHTTAYTAGTLVLAVGLMRRTGASLWPAALARVTAVGALAGVVVWLAVGALLPDDPSRLADAAAVAALGAVGAGIVLAGYRLAGVREALTTRQSLPAPAGTGPEPEVVT
ncbi:MAG TPA: lipid II flippase MurJ [Acidimicrobiales bacterium]|nr:lipid II flippase MurJ [Acidimicrobiales bacterium]